MVVRGSAPYKNQVKGQLLTKAKSVGGRLDEALCSAPAKDPRARDGAMASK